MVNSSNRNSLLFGAQAVLWLIFAAAIGFLSLYFLQGDQILELFSIQMGPVSTLFGLRLDIVSVLMFSMISLLGAIIGKYSNRYLRGESRQNHFYVYLIVTLIAASLLVLSNNLIMFFSMWILSSAGLHQLLLYNPERPLAVAAARKKFYVSRLGDLAIMAAIFITYKTFSTFDFSELFVLTRNIVDHSPEGTRINLIGVLFAFGAMCKSAQFPFHFWLPETMETPAPVSALMHAGIINAGGFLIIRLSPMLQHAEIAHLLLALLGSITAVFGALCMITQNDIKKKLAYSTISQMGLMMVSCGLGAYSLALFHIIAHSFYKAHAFLSTGVLVEESKKVKFNHSTPSALFLGIASILGCLIVVLGAMVAESVYIAYFTYAAILMLGLVQNIDFGEKPFSKMGNRFYLVLSSTLFFGLILCLVFESFLHVKLETTSPMSWGTDPNTSYRIVACLASYFIFVSGLWLSALLIESKGSFTRQLYLYFWNGGYFTQLTHSMFTRNVVSKGAR